VGHRSEGDVKVSQVRFADLQPQRADRLIQRRERKILAVCGANTRERKATITKLVRLDNEIGRTQETEADPETQAIASRMIADQIHDEWSSLVAQRIAG